MVPTKNKQHGLAIEGRVGHVALVSEKRILQMMQM